MDLSPSLTPTLLRQIEPSSTHVEAELFVVPVSQLSEAFPSIQYWLSLAIRPDWTIDGVREDLEQGKAQAWGMRRGNTILGFWITRIEVAYGKKYGLVWITCGTCLHEGVPLYRETIEPWFKSLGCQWIEIIGRKGWKKILDDYREDAVVLRKAL